MRFPRPPARFILPSLLLPFLLLLLLAPVRAYLASNLAVVSVAFGFITSLVSMRHGIQKTERAVLTTLTIVAGAFTLCSAVASQQKQTADADRAESRYRHAEERYEKDKQLAEARHTQDLTQQRELFRDVTATLREMASAPTAGLKRKALKLAADILDFHADRTAPKAIMMGGGVIPLSQEQQAEYDAETLRQYKNRFAGPVASVVADLKAYNLTDPDLDQMTLRDPELFTIRGVGEGLRRLGNRMP